VHLSAEDENREDFLGRYKCERQRQEKSTAELKPSLARKRGPYGISKRSRAEKQREIGELLSLKQN